MTETKSKQSDLFEAFGIDKETFEKSKDILPTLDLGELETGSEVYIQFLESMPIKEVEHQSKFGNKGEKVKTKVLTVSVEKILRQTDSEKLEIPIGEKQTLWLSSKSLRLGIMRIASENNNNLEGLKVVIKKGLATYKQYGENTCYNVVQL